MGLPDPRAPHQRPRPPVASEGREQVARERATGRSGPPHRRRRTAPPDPPRGQDDVYREVSRREARKLRSRSEKRAPWFGLRMFGMVGWSVAVPTLIGLAAGLYLDRLRAGGGRVSWTLTLLVVGVIAGCLNAWHWVSREAGLDGDGRDAGQDARGEAGGDRRGPSGPGDGRRDPPAEHEDGKGWAG